ncbi:MAG: hypothetical protein HW413_1453 [Thermoleophilia bacterium]|nr:hypothetical protein [Thermoleophilia bacterium]
MPSSHASVELLAGPDDVWRFLAEPYHLADWWPNLVAVHPDRLGLAAGARWRTSSHQATLFRRADSEDTLLVVTADPGSHLTFEFVRARMRAELTLTRSDPDRTRAELRVSGPLLLGFSRGIARDALTRLHNLVQTAATV